MRSGNKLHQMKDPSSLWGRGGQGGRKRERENEQEHPGERRGWGSTEVLHKESCLEAFVTYYLLS